MGEDRWLSSRGIVITGAATGSGRAIATAFLDGGDRVHILDQDPDLAARAAEADGFSATVGDVADRGAVEQLFSDARAEMGRIDVLVNNAGVAGPAAAVEDIDPEAWQRTMDVNITGAFLCTQQAVRVMRQGSIVNIASTAGIMGYPWRAPYAASKWAMVGLTKTLAMELGGRGIRVNAVCPGSVAGDRIERVIAAEAEARNVTPEAVHDAYLRQSSLGRFIDPAEVAAVVVFLCSPAAATMNGQVLAVDGNTETLRT